MTAGRAARTRGLLAWLAGPLVALLVGAASAPAQSTHVLVVTGLGGAPEHSARFADWGARLRATALAEGVPPDQVTWLAERASLADGVAGASRLEAVAGAVRALIEASEPGDLVLIAFFGHGSARGGETRINLPGPDLSAAALAELVEPLSDRRLVVVNAASASGGFVGPLSAPGRVLITATRSAGEAEATRFGGHFVDALEGGADTDKDGRVSMLEAFEYASREVARGFAAAGHLPTEHALLEDHGDGRLAAALALAPPAPGAAAAPELAALREREASLRSELDTLRARQASMSAEAYEASLEALLLDIARVGREIREMEAREGGDGAGGGGPP